AARLIGVSRPRLLWRTLDSGRPAHPGTELQATRQGVGHQSPFHGDPQEAPRRGVAPLTSWIACRCPMCARHPTDRAAYLRRGIYVGPGVSTEPNPLGSAGDTLPAYGFLTAPDPTMPGTLIQSAKNATLERLTKRTRTARSCRPSV